jgi:MATE family multidrug resistance protein
MLKVYMSYDCSVRVCNELGAIHPRVTKLSVLVVNGNNMIISVGLSTVIMIFRVALSKFFTTDSVVHEVVSKLTLLIAIFVVLNGIQPILSVN